MAMTLCPQTAPNVLNLSYRRGWDPGSLPPSVLIMFCNYKRSRCPDGWVGTSRGGHGVGILPHREPDVQG